MLRKETSNVIRILRRGASLDVPTLDIVVHAIGRISADDQQLVGRAIWLLHNSGVLPLRTLTALAMRFRSVSNGMLQQLLHHDQQANPGFLSHTYRMNVEGGFLYA